MKSKSIIVVTLTTILLGCKKIGPDERVITASLKNYLTDDPISGITVTLIEQKDVTPPYKWESEYEEKVIWQGTTNQNGLAHTIYTANKNSEKYKYLLQYEGNYGEIKFYDKSNPYGAGFYVLSTNQSQNIDLHAIQKTPITFHIKNTQCSVYNAKLKYQIYWKYSEKNYHSGDVIGCKNYYQTFSDRFCDSITLHYSVERNGITDYFVQTYFVGPNSNDTIQLFY